MQSDKVSVVVVVEVVVVEVVVVDVVVVDVVVVDIVVVDVVVVEVVVVEAVVVEAVVVEVIVVEVVVAIAVNVLTEVGFGQPGSVSTCISPETFTQSAMDSPSALSSTKKISQSSSSISSGDVSGEKTRKFAL